MAEGELGAVFRGLAKNAAETAERMTESIAKVTEQTADIEQRNVAALLESDARAAERIKAAGGTSAVEEAAAGAAPAGPPWRVDDEVVGPARGKGLKPPNHRHTVGGARSGEIKPHNTVILRGNEQAVKDDVRGIAAGNAEWDEAAAVYRISGRAYRVEPQGTVFPVSGAGLVHLDRNEYAALKEIAKADGDPSKVTAFTRNPRFTAHPEAIAKAKAIYDGTYPQ
jgi:hypothetical protein